MSNNRYQDMSEALMLSEQDQDFLAMTEAAAEYAKLQTADDFREELLDRIFNQPALLGAGCRIQKLDDKLRFPPGQVTLWFGPNGHGKSLITSQIALDLAFEGEVPLICSFEMSPMATLHRMVKQSAGSGTPTRAWVEAFLEWAHARLWVYNHRGQAVSTKLLDLIRYAAQKRGIKHVFIDSLMKCVKGEEDYDGQKLFVDQCCQLALSAGIHVHLVHHVRKGVDESSYPRKYDAKGSGAIFDQVDCGVGVWRNKKKEEKRRANKEFDENEPDAVLVIDKNRHIEWEGTVGLFYLPGAQCYSDVRAKPIRYDLSPWMPEVGI